MTLHANVTPIRATIYADARRVAFSAGDDWPRIMGAAATLEQSPDHADQNVARHLRIAHSLHEAGLLHPVDPIHRDRADLVDAWKAQAAAPANPRAGTIRSELPRFAALLGFCAAVLVVAYVGGPM